jgi:hypothetical protein
VKSKQARRVSDGEALEPRALRRERGVVTSCPPSGRSCERRGFSIVDSTDKRRAVRHQPPTGHRLRWPIRVLSLWLVGKIRGLRVSHYLTFPLAMESVAKERYTSPTKRYRVRFSLSNIWRGQGGQRADAGEEPSFSLQVSSVSVNPKQRQEAKTSPTKRYRVRFSLSKV